MIFSSSSDFLIGLSFISFFFVNSKFNFSFSNLSLSHSFFTSFNSSNCLIIFSSFSLFILFKSILTNSESSILSFLFGDFDLYINIFIFSFFWFNSSVKELICDSYLLNKICICSIFSIYILSLLLSIINLLPKSILFLFSIFVSFSLDIIFVFVFKILLFSSSGYFILFNCSKFCFKYIFSFSNLSISFFIIEYCSSEFFDSLNVISLSYLSNVFIIFILFSFFKSLNFNFSFFFISSFSFILLDKANLFISSIF